MQFMKHVFFIHSNIAAICAYDTIKSVLSEGGDVVVLLTRNTKWQFDVPGVSIIDISKLMKLFYIRVPRIRNIRDFLIVNVFKRRILQYFNRLFDNNEYIAYIPQYHIAFISFLCDNKLCSGYYYMEEGTLSYLELERIKKTMSYSLKYRIISILTGVPYHFAYYINHKMKGTIALNANAFPWYKGHKIVNQFHPSIVDKEYYSVNQRVVVLPPLTFGIDELIFIVEELTKVLHAESPAPISVKFHPRTGLEEKDNMAKFLPVVEKHHLKILPDNYIIEYNLIEGGSDLYSVQVKSSLLIYAVLAGRGSFFVTTKNNRLFVNKMSTIQQILS